MASNLFFAAFKGNKPTLLWFASTKSQPFVIRSITTTTTKHHKLCGVLRKQSTSRKQDETLQRLVIQEFIRGIHSESVFNKQAIVGLSRHKSLKSIFNSNLRKFSVIENNVYSLVVQQRAFHRTSLLQNEIKVVSVPQLAESISEGDIRWEKAVGDAVKEDEVIGEIETDKTSVPINSPVAGVIEELLVTDGSTVKPGQNIVKIRVGAAPAAGAAKPAPKEEPKPAAAAPPPPSAPPPPQAAPPPPKASPPPSSVPLSSTPVSSIKPVTPQQQIPVVGDSRGEQRVKMNRMRQRIAQRLKDAQNIYAMLTTFNEIDMTNIIELRNSQKDAFLKKHGLKLGFMSAFVKASAYALSDQPIVNAVIDDQEIVYRDYIDISVAVATPKGLVVPVLRNVRNMNYADIERAIAELGEKARNNTLAIEDMDGGTFTISNGGVFGSMFGTPIINPPQSAILGMHAIIERPVVINKKVEIRPMMYVALTYDHRLVDGREAVTFLRKIKAAVEDPRIMLLDL